MLLPVGVYEFIESVPLVKFPVGVPADTCAVVPEGVPAVTFWLIATAAEVVFAVPAALTAVAALLVPVPKVAIAICLIVVVVGICQGNSCWWTGRALPVKV